MRLYLLLIVVFVGSMAGVRADDVCDTLVVFPVRESGQGYRGFLGSYPEASAEVMALAGRQGIMLWSQRIDVKSSVEAAQAHDQLIGDVMLKRLYFVGEATQIGDAVQLNRAVYFVEGVPHFLDSETVLATYDARKFVWREDFEAGGGFYFQEGWCFPKVRGIIEYKDTLGSDTFKKLRGKYRKLLAEGYRIRIDGDFDRSVEEVARQVRTVAGSGSDHQRVAQPVSGSRYNEDMKDLLRQRHAQGEVFSVELWDPEKNLIAGSIVFKNGSLFEGDTVFYKKIDHAKVLVMYLIEHLHLHGVDFVDAGMVTPFTRGLKGKLVDASVFLALVAKLPSSIELRREILWEPSQLSSK